MIHAFYHWSTWHDQQVLTALVIWLLALTLLAAATAVRSFL